MQFQTQFIVRLTDRWKRTAKATVCQMPRVGGGTIVVCEKLKSKGDVDF